LAAQIAGFGIAPHRAGQRPVKDVRQWPSARKHQAGEGEIEGAGETAPAPPRSG